MNNKIVKALIDTEKPDTVEFQMFPGSNIGESDIISYDKLNGIHFQVKSVNGDFVTCSIKDSDIYTCCKYFQPGTILFRIFSSRGEYGKVNFDNDSI